MPTPAQRSRSFVKKKVKTPGGRAMIHYVKKAHSKARCAECKRPLAGVPTGYKHEMKRLTRSQKRPERAYGGFLCPSCTKKVLKEKKLTRFGYA